MILVDYSGLALQEIFGYFYKNSDQIPSESEDLIRHLILSRLLDIRKQFGKKFGNVVICRDSKKTYWRKQFFPNYKVKRKETRDKIVDFVWCVNFVNNFADELKEVSHYKVIDVDHAEGDDVIAVLTKRFINHEDVLIIARDEDYKQLQKLNTKDGHKVKQYDMIRENYIESYHPKQELFEKVLKGDSGDSIPNVLTDDDVFKEHRRQVVMSKQRLDKVKALDPELVTDDVKRNIKRNRILIDFDMIPDSVAKSINKVFDDIKTGTKMDLMTYMIKHNMKILVEEIEGF